MQEEQAAQAAFTIGVDHQDGAQRRGSIEVADGQMGMRYEVVKAVAVRDGPSNTAQEFKVGELSAGAVVTAIELGTTTDGSMRIRIDESGGSDGRVKGWVNLTTKLGSPLLRPLSGQPQLLPPSPSVGADSAAAAAAAWQMRATLDSAERKLSQLGELVQERDRLQQLKQQRALRQAATATPFSPERAAPEAEAEAAGTSTP
eukprot:SAG25_NODE_197_length_12126_cov_39.030515_20_plen_202_part_00